MFLSSGSVALGELLLPLVLAGGGGFYFICGRLRRSGCCRGLRGFWGMIPVIAMLVMDMAGSGPSPMSSLGSLGHLDEGHLKFRENAGEDLLLILVEVASGLFPDDLEVVDEHSGGIEIDFGLTRRRMGHLTKTKGCLLCIHHDKFDEALGEVGRVGGLLDFGHGILGYGV